jgi:hypothetical protein
MAAAFLIVVLADPGRASDIVSPRAGAFTTGVIAMPATATDAFALAAGLAMYAAGLFASVTGRASRARGAPARA